MATASSFLDLFSQDADENEAVVVERVICPALDSAILVVKKAELTEPELVTYGERQFYSMDLSIQFIVDNEEARTVTMQDEPMIFHRVRVNCKTTADGNPAFDWSKNVTLIQFLNTFGVMTHTGTKPNFKWVGNPRAWAVDLVGRSAEGKITQVPTKAKNPETGEWTDYKLDQHGEPVMRNEVVAFAALG